MSTKRNIGIILCILGIIGFIYAAVLISNIESDQYGWSYIICSICLPISTVFFLVGLVLTIDAIVTIRERNKVSPTVKSTDKLGEEGIGRLPIKTFFAAWWMIIASVTGSTAAIALIIDTFRDCDECAIGGAVACLVIVFAGLFSLLSGIFLARKRRRTWIAAVVLLIIVICSWVVAAEFTIAFISYHLSFIWIAFGIFFILYLVTLALIVYDKNNYWAMVEYRTAMKKAKSPTDEVSSHPSDNL